MSPCPMWHIAYLGPTDWTEPNISTCWPTAWREMNCSILKSPEGQSAVEILCTFQWGPSHLHCLFSSFGRQLYTLKLSLLNSAKCDSHHWILHKLIKDSSSRMAHAQTSPNTYHVQVREPLLHKSFIQRAYLYAGYPCNLGPQQTLHTSWHHLEVIWDPPQCRDITQEETLSKSSEDTN